MIHLIMLYGGFAVMLAVCLSALWLGDRPAKMTGAACIAAWVGSNLAQNKADYYNPQFGVAAVDVALLVFLIVMAIRYRRNWLIAAGGFHMLAVATHLAYLLDQRIHSNTYITAGYLWAYLTLAALALGTLGAWRARRLAKSGGGS